MICMEDFSVWRLVEKDIEFVYQMNVTEDWNDRINDIRRMFNYEPDGSLVAEVDGVPVGHVFTVNYGRLGWIGLLIVKLEYRKKGVGTLLMKKAVDYLLHCGVETIKLEAVPEISDLYRRLGFIDEFDSLRFISTSRKTVSRRIDSTKGIERGKMADIARFDAEYFGTDRTRVLLSLYQENPKLCFACYEGSDVVGYVMCRRATRGYNLGPFVCNPKNLGVARELLARSIEKIGPNTAIYSGIPATNEKAVMIFQEFGFKPYSKSIRMHLGKHPTIENVSGIFAIGGAMKG